MKSNLISPLTLLAAAVALLQLAPAREGQTVTRWPKTAVYAVASFATPGAKLRGFDPSGTQVYAGTYPAGGSADSVCMDATNDGLLIADTTGVQRWPLSGGPLPAFLSRPGSDITWLDVDEDGGIVWCTFAGEIYRAPSVGGPAALIRSDPGVQYNSIAWNGSDGQYVAVRFSQTSGTGTVHKISRNGVVSQTIARKITAMSGVDWDPFTGNIIISRMGHASPSLLAVSQSGTVKSYGPASPITAVANSVEVVENPQLLVAGSPRFVGGEFGPAPQHIYRKRPDATAPVAIHTSAGFVGPSDLEVVRSRQIWGFGPWRQGMPGVLSLNFGPARAVNNFKIALSFGHAGIPLGAAGTLHLSLDGLFMTSLALPGLAGTLNLAGRAFPNPSVAIPAGTAGLRVFAGAVAMDASGVSEVSNCFGVTIQP